jgi:hypothetical protein
VTLDPLELVKAYTGTVVVDVAAALAVIAVETRPDGGTLSEATLTALRVTEAARLLCQVSAHIPPKYLTAEEEAKLRDLLVHYTPPEPT